MDGLVALLLAAPLAFASFRAQGPAQAAGTSTEAWKATWKDLARLESAAAGSPERDRLWRALDTIQVEREWRGHKTSDRAEALRARVLRYHLARVGGATPRPIAEPGARFEFLPGEAWLAVQALGPGPTRARATRAALAEARGEELKTRSERAAEVAAEDARDLHLDWALEEARSLQEYEPDPGSAVLLARILRLRGEYDAAVQVLDGARAKTAELFLARADVHAAAGAEDLALSDLGAALADGSVDACLRLGVRALSDAEIPRARALFRSLIGSPEGNRIAPSALRGYGLALLAPGLAQTPPNSLAADPDPRRNSSTRLH